MIEDCLSTITDSVVADNGTEGGILLLGGDLFSETFVERSEIRGNDDSGIVALSRSRVTLIDSTVAENEAYAGGGIQLDDHATLHATNSTISGNRARAHGGGVYRHGGLWGGSSLNNTTLADNVADGDNDGIGDGGGVFDLAQSDPYDFVLRNTIVADNRDRSGQAPDCVGNGTLASAGFNLIGDSTGCVLVGDTSDDQFDTDAKLQELAANGGPTRTHRLGDFSPAIDAVAPGECTTVSGAAVAFDQRGRERPYKISCDSGAYELDSEPSVPTLGFSGRLVLAGVAIALATARLGTRRSRS